MHVIGFPAPGRASLDCSGCRTARAPTAARVRCAARQRCCWLNLSAYLCAGYLSRQARYLVNHVLFWRVLGVWMAGEVATQGDLGDREFGVLPRATQLDHTPTW